MEKEKELKKEKEIFDNIIGYDDIKKTLKTIVDMLNNGKKYKKMGCAMSHGLLLYGPPGTGKTSIANEIMNNVQRTKYVIRKVKSDGSFINYMNGIFDKAKKNQPSIILLDDIDKFSENGGFINNNEEYVAVQSFIDSIKDEDIYVIATANDISSLPKSLKRAGRLDNRLLIDIPKEKDMVKVFTHYLKSKKIDDNVNIKNISCILSNTSCAELENVCNQAGIYAAYDNKKKIYMEDLVRAALELKYEAVINDINQEDNYAINVAYHEAGHALIGELLEPGSVSFITIAKSDSNTRGFTTFHNNDDYFSDIKFMTNRVKTLLAGKAATEVVFNSCDVGTSSDLDRAYTIVRRLVDDYCMNDFNSCNFYGASEKAKMSKEDNANRTITDYYSEVKTMLIENRHILDALANELKDKKILFENEIKEIIDSFNKEKKDI